MSIPQVVAARQIKQLVHFTRVDNLPSILQHGLLTRTECGERCVAAINTDPHRLDGQDAICLSISFPNYKMFYDIRMRQPEVSWVVVGIGPSVLWEKDCAFCKTNAASASVTCIPIAERKGETALLRLFDDFGEKKRVDLAIPDHYATNPQAEVLVFDPIESTRILGVAFQTQQARDQYAAQHGDGPILMYKRGLFSGRVDHAHWK